MTDTLERKAARVDEPRTKRGSRVRTFLFVALLVSLGLAATGVLPVQQYLEREAEVAEAQADLDALETENAQIQEDVDALLTDPEIERIAREQYGYVRPGEIGYVVTTPEVLEDPAPAATPEPVAPVLEEPDDRGFLQKIWDFVTGNDVTRDG